jgi:hypothetical protein
MKHDAIVDQGIPIHERVPIPDDMIPADSRVEIDAKIQAGYFTTGNVMTMEELANVKGRGWEDIDVRSTPFIHIYPRKLTSIVALNRAHDLVSRMQSQVDESSDRPAPQRYPTIRFDVLQWTRTLYSITVWSMSTAAQVDHLDSNINQANQYLHISEITGFPSRALLPSHTEPSGHPQATDDVCI